MIAAELSNVLFGLLGFPTHDLNAANKYSEYRGV